MGKRKLHKKFDGKPYRRLTSTGTSKKKAQKWAQDIRKKEDKLVRVNPERNKLNQRIYVLYTRSK